MLAKNKILVKTGTLSFRLFALLGSRILLFAAFQAIIALVLFSWHESVKYWMLTATLTNLVSLFLLVRLLKNEGIAVLQYEIKSTNPLHFGIGIFCPIRSVP